MILEIIKLEKKDKTPLFLEIPVPEKTYPYLVGNPKKEGSLLSWAEKPSPRNTILSWGLECKIEEIICEMVEISKKRNNSENWGLNHISIKEAKAYFKDIGIDEVQINNNIISPKDPSLLGSIILIGEKKYPLIHNVRRGLGILEGE